MPRWDNTWYDYPVERQKVQSSSNWFLWILLQDGVDTIVASEHVYSTLYSRFIKLGDLVVSAGEATSISSYIPPKGTRGVVVEILQPYERPETDYVFRVAFESGSVVAVKASHLLWQKHQRIKISEPPWRCAAAHLG